MNPFKICPIIAILTIPTAQAGPYLGAGAAMAIVDVETECTTCAIYDVHKLSVKPALFAGYRFDNTAVEFGLGYGAYRGHAIVPSRPADVRQEIDSRFVYIAGVEFVPLKVGEAFIGLGAARVSARNYEHGLTQKRLPDDSIITTQVTNQTYTKELAPFFQVGYQYGPVRVGVSFIPNVVRSPWTRQENIWSPSVAYVLQF